MGLEWTGMTIKAVFFDLYNTLLGYDPPREDIQAEICRRFGIEVDAADLRWPLTVADEYIYGEFSAIPMGQRTDEELKNVWLNYERILLREAGFEPDARTLLGMMGMVRQAKFNTVLYDDVIPALDELKKRGILLGLISNVDKDITPTLEPLGLVPWLDVIVTSKDAGATKPDPRIFLEAVRRADGVSPAEAMYVGDQYQADAVGACNAGLSGVFLDRGDYFREVTDCPRILGLSELTGLLD